MSVELVWDGKYDKNGQKVAPLRVALPFQTVETVNESVQQRQLAMDAWASGKTSEWRNRLIWGDKKYVLPSLLPEFAGKVDLIYIDPPFDTGGNFSYLASVPPPPDSDSQRRMGFTKQPNVVEENAYRDTWGRGLDSYLQWFFDTVACLRELLTEDGSLFVHLDWHVGHYAKLVLDEVFGPAQFQNEIIWQRTDPHNDAVNKFGTIHDTIFWFSKSGKPRYYHSSVRTDLSSAALREFSLYELADGNVVPYWEGEARPGRRFKLDDATWKGTNPAKKFSWRGATPADKREWSFGSPEEMDEALTRGELYLRDPTKGAARCRKRYLDLNKGILLQDIWTDTGRMKGGSSYATEKPEDLLDRIVKACSREGDLVLDCFVGSGTTAAVAEKLGRRWIACDLGRFAIHTTRKRLLAIPNVKPFVVQNLGKYERQEWQKVEFGDDAEAKAQSYRKFILELYKAQPITGYAWLHGVKAGRMVHVGAVDAPVAPGDIRQIVAEFRKAVGTGKDAPTTNGIDVLGWDFAFELNEVAKQQAEQANVNLRFLRIPRDVMEQRAKDQGDVRFFELAALSVAASTKKRAVTLTLTDFSVPPDDVPEDVRRAVKHWSQWIDYWAVDWDNKSDTFHNQWQAYRTRKEPDLQKSISRTYEQAGEYAVVVKVIDILGNDTTKTLKVKVS